MKDDVFEQVKGLDSKKLEDALNSILLECGAYAEITDLSFEAEPSVHTWEIAEMTIQIRRVGIVGSMFACS